MVGLMKEISPEPARIKYRWPWILLAAVVLGIVLYFVWVGLEVRHLEQERDFSAPLPVQAK